MPDILHEITIAAPPDQIYRAITEQQGLAAWWSTDARAEPIVGAPIRASFHTLEVLILDADRKVEWISRQSDFADWIGTHISFELTPVGQGTKLLFSQRGFATAEGSLPKVSFGWAMYLLSLRQYLETGTGNPFKR